VSSERLLAYGPLLIAALAILSAWALFVPARRLFQRRSASRMRALERLATARVLHRIRNPLQTILLDADLLQDDRTAADPAARRELSEAILTEAMRMSEMLAEMSPEPPPTRPNFPESG
jgi:hypothetical protein